MKRILLFLILTIALLMPSATIAQSVSVECAPQVIQGNNFAVTFTVENINGHVSQAPELKNCQLLYGPSTTSFHSSSYVNGRVSSTSVVKYSFVYRAIRPGRVTIPSVSVSDGRHTYKTTTRSFEVLPPGKDQPSSQNQDNTSGVRKIYPDDLIVTTTFSKSNIYEQEAVIATIKVYTKVPIRDFRVTTLPVFEGFLAEDIPSSPNVRMEHFRGDNYYSAVLRQYLLYPKKSGRLKINSGQYEVTVLTFQEISMGYQRTRREIPVNITTRSNETSVNVIPLPEPRPEGFNGAVGVYNVTTSLEPAQLRTNESATYSFKISGTGNLKNLIAPEIPFPSSVETYNPDAKADAKFNGSDMTGTFTADFSFVPKHEGELVIPAWKFVYFDPKTRKYVTVEIPEYKRNVLRGSVVASEQTDIKKMSDIEHITPLSSDKLSFDRDSVFGSLIYILAYIIIIVGLVGAVIVYRRQINLRADIVGRRTAHASKVANKRLHLARKAMHAHQNDEFYALLAQAMWGYISDKLHIPASALTRDNIAEKLHDYGAPEALALKTIELLDACEMARFTPGHSDTEVSSLYNDAVAVIKDLEAVRRAKKPTMTDDDTPIIQE